MQHISKLTGLALAFTLAGFTAGAAANDVDRPISLTLDVGVNLMEPSQREARSAG